MSKTIIIQTDDGTDTITTTDGYGTEAALSAHGYDPETADYTVES